jgi:YVTN family beta-propeller protein
VAVTPRSTSPRQLPSRRLTLASGLLALLVAVAGTTVFLAGRNRDHRVSASRPATGTPARSVVTASPTATASATPLGGASGPVSGALRGASGPASGALRGASGPVNVYANDAAGMLSPNVTGVPTRVYVPNTESNTVSVIDPATGTVISTFPVPSRPQHVVPSPDMKTLYVNSDNGNALTPIDPMTGKPGTPIPVTDPYNLYFTPDGTRAIVVPERFSSLDFRDPHTWTLVKRVTLPCLFPNHMDFTADGTSLVVSCEGSGQLVRVDVATMEVTGVVHAGKSPQDIRLSADGKVFYVADQDLGGVEIIDAATLQQLSFLPTGAGTHGMYPSRDAKQLYVSNRLAGTVSVIDYATRKIVATWPIPGGSPDMGGVSADGTQLWLSGRYNSEVYVIDTTTGALKRIPVGRGPHGLCLFPQPGRISLGHTGNYR